jgi:drug/metabolite transporter (DMT)-like permease
MSQATQPQPGGPQPQAPQPGNALAQTVGLGILMGCAAVFLLTTMDTTAKWLGTVGVPTFVVVWMRFVSPQIVVGALFTYSDGWSVWRSKAPWLQAGRSISLATATVCLFIALRYLSMTTNVAIIYLIPFFVAALAYPLLGERLKLVQWLCILGGLGGVALVIKPWTLSDSLSWPFLFSFGMAICTAFYQLFSRMAARYDSLATSQVYTTLAGCLVFAPLALMGWPAGLDWHLLLVLATYGLLGGVAHWFMTNALSFTPASIISPLFYSNILWVVLYDALLFGKPPSALTLAGCAVVIAFGLLFFRLRNKAVS